MFYLFVVNHYSCNPPVQPGAGELKSGLYKMGQDFLLIRQYRKISAPDLLLFLGFLYGTYSDQEVFFKA